MDVMLQHHEAKRVVPVPEGLRELAADFTREVLRYQPENIPAFIANYVTVLFNIRETAREASGIIEDIFILHYFLDNLFRTKGVTADEAHRWATVIQAAWRGYVVRRKLKEWLGHKEEILKEREQRRMTWLLSLVEGFGITLEEATRAAIIIQRFYREWTTIRYGSKYSGPFNKAGVLEVSRFGARVRELDIALDRYDKWSREVLGAGTERVLCYWPAGSIQRLHYTLIPHGVERIEFYVVKDDDGRIHYTFMKRPAKGEVVGFLIPIQQSALDSSAVEVVFTSEVSQARMGHYTFIYRKNVETEDMEQFFDILSVSRELCFVGEEGEGGHLVEAQDSTLGYDPLWVVPRALVRIPRQTLMENDDEVVFKNEEEVQDAYVFRAETIENTRQLISNILREHRQLADKGLSMKYVDVSTLQAVPTVGRLLPIGDLHIPWKTQKIVLTDGHMGETGMEDWEGYEYVFVPSKELSSTPKPAVIEILKTRFRNVYDDDAADFFESQTFVMGLVARAVRDEPLDVGSALWEKLGTQACSKFIEENAYQFIITEEVEEEGVEKEEEKIWEKQDAVEASEEAMIAESEQEEQEQEEELQGTEEETQAKEGINEDIQESEDVNTIQNEEPVEPEPDVSGAVQDQEETGPVLEEPVTEEPEPIVEEPEKKEEQEEVIETQGNEEDVNL